MQCPSCHKEVTLQEKDIGALFTCPECRSVYFINFDGTPEYGEVVQPSEEELHELQNQHVKDNNKNRKANSHKTDKTDDLNAMADLTYQPVHHEVSQEAAHQAFENPLVNQEFSNALTQPTENNYSESLSRNEFSNSLIQSLESNYESLNESQNFESLDTSLDALKLEQNDFSAKNDEFSLEVASEKMVKSESSSFGNEENLEDKNLSLAYHHQPQSFQQVAADIEQFGNAQTVVSGISYDLEVSGLDTKEVMSLFKEAIDDSKFSWIADEIMASLKNGVCTFKNLSPIEAYVLSRRIQFLSVEIKWRQNAIV
ncbi:MAG: hypothetical protein ACK41T_03170 [Pseudobdellovibrio sp.]